MPANKKLSSVCPYCHAPYDSVQHQKNPMCRQMWERAVNLYAAQKLRNVDLRAGSTVEGYFRSRMNR